MLTSQVWDITPYHNRETLGGFLWHQRSEGIQIQYTGCNFEECLKICQTQVHRAALWILGEYCERTPDMQALMSAIRQVARHRQTSLELLTAYNF